MVDNLVDEIKLLQKLQNPYIVKYYGCKQDENFLNIYLEYMSGKIEFKLIINRWKHSRKIKIIWSIHRDTYEEICHPSLEWINLLTQLRCGSSRS